jgi:hypothetical protein
MTLLSFATSSVIMVSSLTRFSRRLASKELTGEPRILFPRSTRPLPSCCPARSAVPAMLILMPMTMLPGLLLPLMISSEFLFAFVGIVKGLFFFLFMSPLASYVEGTSLTTSLQYQDSRLEIS